MYDEDEDPTDEDDLSPTSASLSVNARIPVGSAGLAVPGVGDLLGENRRIYNETAKQLSSAYDNYAALLKAQRVGSSKKDQIIGALAAFAQPTKSGKFGEALANSGTYLAKTRMSDRQAQEERDLALAKLGMDKDVALATLAEKYGISGLSLSAKMAGKNQPKYYQADYVADARDPTHSGFIYKQGPYVGKRVEDVQDPLVAPAPGGTGAPAPGGTGAPQGDAQSVGAPPPAPPGAENPAPGAVASSKTRYIVQTGDELARQGIPGFQAGDTRKYKYDTGNGTSEPLKQSRPATRVEALRAGLSRGEVDENGKVTGAEADRLPTPEAIAENNAEIATQINNAKRLQRDFRALQKRATNYTTGMAGAALKFIPGTPAFQFKEQLTSAVGRIALNELKAMKAMSPQGASGFGALSIPELKLLENSIAAVNQAQNMPDLIRSYNEVIKYQDAVIAKLDAAGRRDEKLRREMIRLQSGNPDPSVAAKGANVVIYEYDINGQRKKK